MHQLYADRLSIVHKMDARVKIIFTLVLVIFISLSPNQAWPAYILYLSLVLSIASLSHLGIGFVLKRSLLALPFALAAFPLIFTGPLPHVSVVWFKWFPLQISPEGSLRFVSIAIKSWISVQAAILLTGTTHFQDMLEAFRQMKVPKIFIAIIGLMWRYLFVIRDEVTRMIQARTSRSTALPGHLKTGGSVFWRARVTGGMTGSLFLRSLERSDRVYAAMLARGYNGALPEKESIELTLKQRWLLVGGIGMIVSIWFIGVVLGGQV